MKTMVEEYSDDTLGLENKGKRYIHSTYVYIHVHTHRRWNIRAMK